MATETDIATEDRPKVYLETSFMFYLTGRETTDQKIASEQAYTRKWWEEQGPRCDWRTSAMRDNEIIAGIREARHAFAAQYGFDPRKISEAAMKIALECGFKVAAISANPNFHYPTATPAAV